MEYWGELTGSIPLTQFLISLGVIAGGTLFGFIFEKLALKRIYRMVSKTRWNGDDIIIHSLRQLITVWFALASIYFVILRRDIDQTLAGLLESILLILLLVTIGIMLSRIASGFIRLYFNNVQGMPSSTLIMNVIRITVAALFGLLILQSFGISIPRSSGPSALVVWRSPWRFRRRLQTSSPASSLSSPNNSGPGTSWSLAPANKATSRTLRGA